MNSEFENYWNKDNQWILKIAYAKNPKEYAEVFWKAALKWAKSQANDIGYYGECVSVDIINKELQNLNHNNNQTNNSS